MTDAITLIKTIDELLPTVAGIFIVVLTLIVVIHLYLPERPEKEREND